MTNRRPVPLRVTLVAVFWLIAAMLLPLINPSAAHGDSEQLYRASYRGTISGWRIDMHRTLTQVGKHDYILTSEAKNLLASIREQSFFSIVNGQLVPNTYVYERRVVGRQVVERIDFDWSNNTALYDRSDRPQNRHEHTLTPNLLDPALYQLALQADLANGNPATQYSFIKRRRVENYEFVLQNNQSFRWNRRDYPALLVMRQDDEQTKITRVWVLPEQNYQIGRIHHVDEEGDAYELQLNDLRSDDKKLGAFFRLLAPPKPTSQQALQTVQP